MMEPGAQEVENLVPLLQVTLGPTTSTWQEKGSATVANGGNVLKSNSGALLSCSSQKLSVKVAPMVLVVEPR